MYLYPRVFYWSVRNCERASVLNSCYSCLFLKATKLYVLSTIFGGRYIHSCSWMSRWYTYIPRCLAVLKYVHPALCLILKTYTLHCSQRTMSLFYFAALSTPTTSLPAQATLIPYQQLCSIRVSGAVFFWSHSLIVLPHDFILSIWLRTTRVLLPLLNTHQNNKVIVVYNILFYTN